MQYSSEMEAAIQTIVEPDKALELLETTKALSIAFDKFEDLPRNVSYNDWVGKSITTLKLRFGLDGHHCHTLAEVGEKLGVSKGRVRQIESKALRVLRTHSKIAPPLAWAVSNYTVEETIVRCHHTMLEKEKYAKQQWRDYHRVRRAREYIAAGLKPPPPIFDDGVTLTDAEKLRKTEAQRKILRNKYGWADVDTGKI